MLLLGSLFNSSKKKQQSKERKEPKPFTAGQKEQDNPIKKLKEMSRDLYKEIQQEFEEEQQQTKPQPKRTVSPKDIVRQVEVKRKEEVAQKVQPVEKRKPKEVVQSKVVTKQKQKPMKKKPLIPTSSDDMMRGMIFSEIIGPPKSKR